MVYTSLAVEETMRYKHTMRFPYWDNVFICALIKFVLNLKLFSIERRKLLFLSKGVNTIVETPWNPIPTQLALFRYSRLFILDGSGSQALR